jgi:hypothetical protein
MMRTVAALAFVFIVTSVLAQEMSEGDARMKWMDCTRAYFDLAARQSSKVPSEKRADYVSKAADNALEACQEHEAALLKVLLAKGVPYLAATDAISGIRQLAWAAMIDDAKAKFSKGSIK